MKEYVHILKDVLFLAFTLKICEVKYKWLARTICDTIYQQGSAPWNYQLQPAKDLSTSLQQRTVATLQSPVQTSLTHNQNPSIAKMTGVHKDSTIQLELETHLYELTACGNNVQPDCIITRYQTTIPVLLQRLSTINTESKYCEYVILAKWRM